MSGISKKLGTNTYGKAGWVIRFEDGLIDSPVGRTIG